MAGSIKRHCFLEEDDGLASLAEIEPGYSGHNHQFYYQHGLVSRTLGYATFYNRDPKNLSSPRSGRFYDARFEDHQPHFLHACSLCKKPLGNNRDIFMYRFVSFLNPCSVRAFSSFSIKIRWKWFFYFVLINYYGFEIWIEIDLLVFGSDVNCWTYYCRGDTPFCSEECRQEQIEIDEAKEKNRNLSSSMMALRKKEQRESVSPNKTQDYSFRAGTVAAA